MLPIVELSGTQWVFLVGLSGALAVAAIVRWIAAVAMVRWITETMDGSTRWVMALAMVPGLVLTVLTGTDGLELPAAVILGLVCALGTTIALLGVLGMEGVVLEKESDAAIRIAEHRGPPSSPLGRAIAVLVGSAIAGLTVVAPGWV